MHSAPVSWRDEKKRPPAATIAFVTARFPLPISPKTTSPPRRCSVRPTASDTSIGRKVLVQRLGAADTLPDPMRLTRRHALLFLAAAAVLVVVAGPWAAPLLIVASLLLTGRYMGEELILAARLA